MPALAISLARLKGQWRVWLSKTLPPLPAPIPPKILRLIQSIRLHRPKQLKRPVLRMRSPIRPACSRRSINGSMRGAASRIPRNGRSSHRRRTLRQMTLALQAPLRRSPHSRVSRQSSESFRRRPAGQLSGAVPASRLAAAVSANASDADAGSHEDERHGRIREAREQHVGLRRGDAGLADATEDSDRRHPAGRASETAKRLFARCCRTAASGRRAAYRSVVDQGSPLLGCHLADDARLRVYGGVVSAQRTLSAGTRRCRADRSEDTRAHSLHRPAVGGGGIAEQLLRAEPGRAEDAHREQRRESASGHDESARRHAARQDLAVGRITLHGRQEHRVDRRLGGLRKRTAASDPVQAAHAEGLRAAAADRAALHQQVLHPRSVAGRLARALCAGAGSAGVHPVVAQRGSVDRAQDLGRFRRGRRAGEYRCREGHHRRSADQHARLLHRRHHSRHCARGGARRATGRVDDAADLDA